MIKKHAYKISNSLFSEILKYPRMIDIQIGENVLLLDEMAHWRFVAIVSNVIKPAFDTAGVSNQRPPFFVTLYRGKRLQVKRDLFDYLIRNRAFTFNSI